MCTPPLFCLSSPSSLSLHSLLLASHLLSHERLLNHPFAGTQHCCVFLLSRSSLLLTTRYSLHSPLLSSFFFVLYIINVNESNHNHSYNILSSQLLNFNNLLAFPCLILSHPILYPSLSHLFYISTMSGEGFLPSKRVRHDREDGEDQEDRESELLQYLKGINVGVQQAFDLITIIIHQHMHIDTHRSASFIPGICLFFSFFLSIDFAISLPHTI